MKKLILVVVLSTGLIVNANVSNLENQINDPVLEVVDLDKDSKDEVKKVVIAQLKASATRNVTKMKSLLHNDFRIVVNQADGLTILNLETMLGFYEQGKFGGEEKEIEIKAVDVQGNLTAMAKIVEKGGKAIFNIYFSLIYIEGEWKIIEEVVYLDYL